MPHDSPSDLIITDPAILAGKPVIAGTRISVQLILEKLRDGWTIDDLLDDYPELSREQVIAVIAYAGIRCGILSARFPVIRLEESTLRPPSTP